jgi:hypothetical protein
MKSSEQALFAAAVIRFSKNASSILSPIMAAVPAPFYQPVGKLQMEVLVRTDTQRLRILEKNRPTTSVVYHEDRSVSLHDHRLKAWVTFPGQEVPRIHIQPAVVARPEIRDEEDRTIVTIIIQDAAIGSIREELVFTKDDRFSKFGASLLYRIHCGPACHENSNFPIEELGRHGCLIEERVWVQGHAVPIMELKLEKLSLVDTSDQTFAPPDGYRRLDELIKEAQEKPAETVDDSPPPARDDPESGFPMADIGRAFSALEFTEELTSDCMGSTRFGSMSAIIHQDLLNHSSVIVNTAAAVVGTATLSGGMLTVPWLSTLSGIPATAPGSGLFSLLRDPRHLPTPNSPTSGTGLLDRIAVKNLRETDGAGMTRLEREFAAGTLTGTLARWGVILSPADTALLTAAGGNMNGLSIAGQMAIFEGYELTDLGTLTLAGLPASLPSTGGPYIWNGLLGVFLTGITGSVNFASLAGMPLISGAAIGSSGNITATLNVPTVTLTAILINFLTPLGAGILGGTALAACIIFPFLCPALALLTLLLVYVLNNVSLLTVTCTGIMLALNIQYQWDPSDQRVNPFVTCVPLAGRITVTNTWVVPNLIGNLFTSLLTSLGNLFNAWFGIMSTQIAPALESGLRKAGLGFPSASNQLMLQAISGFASSTAGVSLMLTADVEPVAGVAAQPFITQVVPDNEMRTLLETSHILMHRDINPQPVPPPPGPGPVITVATYMGLSVSQNALNYHIFEHWRRHGFEVTITNPTLIAHIISLVDPSFFARQPAQIQLWPAAPPRLEVSMEGIVNGIRPLIIFFDDVRACFQLPFGFNNSEGFHGSWEFSFNLKTTGTIQLDWPWTFHLAVDDSPLAVQPSDIRTWEFVDPNVLDIMNKISPATWIPMATQLAAELLRGISASGIVAPPQPPPWSRTVPAMTQEILPTIYTMLSPKSQSIYMEILGRRKALTLLTAVRSDLLELVDGSGAPTLNSLAGLPATGGINLLTMNRAQGVTLRGWLGVLGSAFP